MANDKVDRWNGISRSLHPALYGLCWCIVNYESEGGGGLVTYRLMPPSRRVLSVLIRNTDQLLLSMMFSLRMKRHTYGINVIRNFNSLPREDHRNE